ncbi:hypothetical protein Bca4012_035943 [Brassica carinata]
MHTRNMYRKHFCNSEKKSQLDENSQFLLKRLLDAATEEHLDRQHKVLAQAQLGLPERISTPSTTKVNSVSRGMVKLPSKIGLIHEVVDSIERIETQLSAFQFCSRRGDRTRSCKSPSGVTPTEEDDYSSSVMPFQRLMEPRQSCLKSRRMSRHTTRTSSVAPSLKSVNNTTARRSLYDPTLALQSQESSSRDDQIVLATSRPPLPPIPLRSVGFEKSRQSNRMSQKMRPTLLLDQGNETGTSSESEEQVYSTEQESEEASGETVSTSGSSWQTHAESVTGSDSSYPSESDDYEDDENSQVSDSPPHNRSKLPSKQRKKGTGRLKRFKDKLGKVFHHHHYHHHEHHNKEEDHGRKPSAWKHLVKKHLNKKRQRETGREADENRIQRSDYT